MVSILRNLVISLLTAAISISCIKKEESVVNIPDILYPDGIYIRGEATSFNYLDENAIMKPAINEADGQSREGLYEIFISISSSEKGFNIIEVKNNTQIVYSPSNVDNIILTGENGQITGTIQKGILDSDKGAFTVSENGIYHIIIDLQTGIFILSPVTKLSLSGNAIDAGLPEIEIPLISSFNKSNLIFAITGIYLNEGEFRFHYSQGDKIEIISNQLSVHTTFGGVSGGPEPGYNLSMTPGSSGYYFDKENEGSYTLIVVWTVGEGFTAQLTKTASANYPEKMFMIGDGISALSGENAWNWNLNDFKMIPVLFQPHLFWKIVWLNNVGKIRLSPQKSYDDDFGKEGEEVDGLYRIGEQDINAPGAAGYYLVVVNLYANQISITKPEVYLIGDVVGSWKRQNTQTRFTFNDTLQELYLKLTLKAGNIRMYVHHSKGWFPYWWNTEFNLFTGKIEYLGKELSVGSVTVNNGAYEIKLYFNKDEGSLEFCLVCS